MNENAKILMREIDRASFAVDDITLYLDTHPEDQNALSYYHYVADLRRNAVNAYESQFGPLTIDGVRDQNKWTWITGRWPWEGEV